MRKFNIQFVEKRKLFISISVILVVCSLLSTFIFGLNVDIQFKGGTLLTYIYDGNIDLNDFMATAEDTLGTGVNATTGTDFATQKNNIQLSLISNEGLTADKQFDLTNTLEQQYAAHNVELLESSDISPSSGRTFFLKCLVAVVLSALVLILYIAVRFKHIGGWLAGFCAVAALVHDCIVVYGTFIVFGMSINANFMAVILTILGYSINNTIIIYDRVRENEKMFRKTKSRSEIINLSINQSLTRTINTSVTTIIAMLIVTIVAASYGVTSIISFSFPMVIGLIAGTYSSVCFTCPFWYILSGTGKKQSAKAKAKKA